MVGVSMVKSAIAGYNTSMLAYGQVLFSLFGNFFFLWKLFKGNIFNGCYCPADWKRKNLHIVGSTKREA